MVDKVRLGSYQELMAVAEGGTKVTKGLSWSGTIDLGGYTSGVFHATLAGNVSIILPAPSSTTAFTMTLILTQDTTGGRTLTVKGTASAFGVPITLSTAANAVDIVHLLWDGVRWSAMVGGLSMSIPTSWIV